MLVKFHSLRGQLKLSVKHFNSTHQFQLHSTGTNRAATALLSLPLPEEEAASPALHAPRSFQGRSCDVPLVCC